MRLQIPRGIHSPWADKQLYATLQTFHVHVSTKVHFIQINLFIVTSEICGEHESKDDFLLVNILYYLRIYLPRNRFYIEPGLM